MNNGIEPAYPLPEPEQWVDPFDPNKGTYEANGLTKREYFAGLAMQSIIASKHEEICWWAEDIKRQSFAQAAVGYADALLAQLNKEAGDG